MDIGNTIKEIRKKKGLKQNELAEKSQMTQAYLSKIENNSKEPTIGSLKSIAESLNVPLPILFFHAMTVEDVEPEKRDAFKIIIPSLKGMVETFI
ncbi:helix-turn-helix transcriptional regulator [Olivibacter sp. 47]|uniref:helix-turn-helix domain-containing protein n=1 Tax=Olivibacter sp. 47 TaxID=3056486 RepID=UPI0025A3B918|nr:helix-turn-helix transcriptional regulator [Olivibacter sp. 47]MDM8173655.1 helix-turn-helix transcriptional regulator [Olivibacter sp. 47]